MRGYIEERAGVVEVMSTMRLRLIFPFCTASQSRSIRVSTPGAPLGILEKSFLPSSLPILPAPAFMQKEQWSVETTWSQFWLMPFQRRSSLPLGRRGGDITNLAPSNPGRS